MRKRQDVGFRFWGAACAVLIALPLLCATEARAAEQTVGIGDSVAAALGYNPRLKMLQSNQEAIGFELDRARGGYLPRVDVSAGYGPKRTATRGPGSAMSSTASTAAARPPSS